MNNPIYPRSPDPAPPDEWDGWETCPKCEGEGCARCRWVGAIEVGEDE